MSKDIDCFITARTSSTRLPGKALLPLGERTVIEHNILRAQGASHLRYVVLCTTDDPSDDRLAEVGKTAGAQVFRGSVKDKLVRWLGALTMFGADGFVTYDNDDLFVDPSLIDQAADLLRSGSCDMVYPPEEVVCGGFDFAFTKEALERIISQKISDDTEMIDPYIDAVTDLRRVPITAPAILCGSDARLTLDYVEDYESFKQIITEMPLTDPKTPLSEIMKFLSGRRDIVEHNLFRQKDYLAKRATMRKALDTST